MKKQYCLILFFIVVAIGNAAAQAPAWLWAKALKGPSSNQGGAVVVDWLGNVYTVGSYAAYMDFDPGPAVYNLYSSFSDVFISKLDSAGNFIWAKSFSGPNVDYAHAVAIDTAGNLYMTGSFSLTADFDPGPGTYNLTSAGGYDAFICKLDSAGDLIWAKNLGGSYSDAGYGIAVDLAGNVYTTGIFATTCDFDPGTAVYNLTAPGLPSASNAFISKLDPLGNFVWARSIGSDRMDQSTAIAVDGSGNVYTTGSFAGTVDFNPGPAVYNMATAGLTVDNCFILKLDQSGNFVWAKSLESADDNGGLGIAIDPLRNVYVTGSFRLTTDFDPGTAVYNLTSGGNTDCFILKLDASGGLDWAKAIGGANADIGGTIAVDPYFNVYTGGGFRGSQVDLDPGPGTFLPNVTGPSLDLFVSKLDAQGNFVWAKTADGPANDIVKNLVLDAWGRIYVTGEFQSASIAFDAFTLSDVPGSGSDIFVAKLESCVTSPSIPLSISGNTNPCAGSTETYTVPVVPGAISYSWTLPNGWTGTSTTNSVAATVGMTGGAITVIAHNPCGSSVPQTTNITVATTPPAMVTPSAPAVLCAGDSIVLNANTGIGLTYQWLLNSNTIAGATNIFYAVYASGFYSVVVSAAPCADTSVPVSVVVTPVPAPVIALSGNVLTAPASFTAYQWYRNMLLIPGATNASYTATQPGNYYVVVTNANGCKGESNIISATVGIDMQNGGGNISIYPNPTTGLLRVMGKLTSGDGGFTLHIHDATGRLVHTVYTEAQAGVINDRLDISHLGAGIYFIKFISAHENAVFRLVKK